MGGLWKNNMKSPMTRESLKKTMVLAGQRKAEAFKVREDRSAELLKFASEAVAGNPQMSLEALSRATDYLEVLEPAKFPALAKEAVRLYQQLGKPCPPCYQMTEIFPFSWYSRNISEPRLFMAVVAARILFPRRFARTGKLGSAVTEHHFSTSLVRIPPQAFSSSSR